MHFLTFVCGYSLGAREWAVNNNHTEMDYKSSIGRWAHTAAVLPP